MAIAQTGICFCSRNLVFFPFALVRALEFQNQGALLCLVAVKRERKERH